MSLREVIERIRSSDGTGDTPQTEEEVKAQIVFPVLEALEWDPKDPQQVRLEYRVRPDAGTGGGRVDIALMARNGIPAALVEVKGPKPSVPLDAQAGQLFGYVKERSVEIAVLTNGRTWWLYHPLITGLTIQQRRFEDVDLISDPIEEVVATLRRFLTQEVVLDGDASDDAIERLKAIHLEQTWSEILGEPNPELIDLITRQSPIDRRLAPSLNQIERFLLGQSVSHASDDIDDGPDVLEGDDPIESAKAPEAGGDQRKRAHGRRPVGFELWKQYTPVKSMRGVLIGVSSAVHDRHSDTFDRARELRGSTRHYFSSDKNEIATPLPIGSTGYWIEGTWSSVNALNLCHRLLKHFDYDRDDLKIDYGDEDVV